MALQNAIIADKVLPMGRPIESLELSGEQRVNLERIVNAATSPQRIARRGRIVLLRADGYSQAEAAARAGVTRPSVILWERRFASFGLAGLEEAPGRGKKPAIPEAKKEKLITLATRPPPNKTRWSVRSMAREVGISPSSVQRIWAANEIKPHVIRTFKLSRDRNFEAKFWDVIGLYLRPPDRALVLCCDEKSQCQALERTQPDLPLGIGHIRTRTHDYIRHGTITLFAALNYLDGRILSTTAPKHTHSEWLAFLKKLHRQTPPELALHLIVDNYSTHKHPAVRDWVAKHPRVHLHFTPTSSSWMNLVERFFRQLTDDVVREGSFSSVGELVTAINVHLAHHNLKPTPYRWKAEGAAILAKIHRAREVQAANAVL
jgi:transposase